MNTIQRLFINITRWAEYKEFINMLERKKVFAETAGNSKHWWYNTSTYIEFRVSSTSEIAISDNMAFVQQSGQINCLLMMLEQPQNSWTNTTIYAYLNTMSSTFRSFSSFVLLIQTAKFHIPKLLGWHSWWNLDSELILIPGTSFCRLFRSSYKHFVLHLSWRSPSLILSLILNKQRCQAFKQGN